jgi:hypothetical protein
VFVCCEDQIAVQKLRRNRQITTLDLRWFEDAFVEFGFGTHQDIELVATEHDGLGIYLRSLTGLDREAASAALDRFQRGINLNASQLHFLNMLTDVLAKNGIVDVGQLYEAPFTGARQRWAGRPVPRDGGRRDRHRTSRRALDSDSGRGGGLSTPKRDRKAHRPSRCRRCTGVDRQPRQRRAPQRALALALTEPEVVQITPAQSLQAVDLLASMIVSYVERGHPERDQD